MYSRAPAILLIGNDPTEQHPLLAWQIRNNVRLHRAKLYVINSESIKLRRQATSFTQIPVGSGRQGCELSCRATTQRRTLWSAAGTLIRMRGSRCATNSAANRISSSFSDRRFAADDFASLVAFGSGISGAKFVCLADYANSRGAADMGLYPDLLPGYHPTAGGQRLPSASGRDPAERRARSSRAWSRRARAAS